MLKGSIHKLTQGITRFISRPVGFLITVVSVYCVARLATWGYPFDSDHWIFYYIGNDWVHGGQLYVTAWDHKPPLIFLFNGVMSLVAGDNIILHRIWLTIVSIGTIILFYLLAKQLIPRLLKIAHRHEINDHTETLYIRIATIAFAAITSLSQFASSGNNTENYGLLFLLAMWVFYFRFIEKQKWWYLALAGICLSMLFFLKGSFILFGLPLVVVLVMQYRKKLSVLIKVLAIVGAPLIIQGVGWVLYFWQQGALNDFIVASFSFSAKYASSAWHGGVSNEPLLVAETFAVIIPMIVALAVVIKDSKQGKKHASYVILGLSSFCGIIVVLSVGSFYPYYLQIIMPFVVLLMVYVYAKIDHHKTVRNVFVVFMVIFAVVMTGVSYKQLLNNFSGTAAQDARENQTVANYINSRTMPSDKIFDDGYGATLYQLANRKSGTRFVSASVLLLDYKDHYWFNLDDVFIRDMEASKPVYVVVPAGNDVYEKNIPMMNYIYSHYHLEKTFTTREILRRNE